MKEILLQIPHFQWFYRFGMPRRLPMNLTVSLLYACNSRCKTCNVWKKKARNLTLEEYDKTFRSLGRHPYWITLSGGEPFLRTDIAEICALACRHCRPRIVNIPTNGLLTEKIQQNLPRILEACPCAEVVVNLSLDQIGTRHDEIRGVPGNYEKAMRTYGVLKEIKRRYPKLTIGIHTVISNYNVDDFPAIYEELMRLEPDSYITEIAEERVELDTLGTGITPSLEKYTQAIDFLILKMKAQKCVGLARIARAFRLRYYELVKQTLARREQVLPCYAGVASAQIAPDGDVWACCVRAEPLGNLRDVDYDFAKIWRGAKADAMRRSIKNKECCCPLANAGYTNMLMHAPTLWRVGLNLLARK